MKKFLALLSLISLGLAAGQAQAGILFNKCCEKHTVTYKCTQYNAFSPWCCTEACKGGFHLGNWAHRGCYKTIKVPACGNPCGNGCAYGPAGYGAEQPMMAGLPIQGGFAGGVVPGPLMNNMLPPQSAITAPYGNPGLAVPNLPQQMPPAPFGFTSQGR
jgi:hypothetical protein